MPPDNGWSHYNDDEDGSSSSTTTPSNVPPPHHVRATNNGQTKPASHHRTSREYERRHLYEEQARELKKQLLVAKRQVQAEQLRASGAENNLKVVTGHLKLINEQRVAAVRDAARANEELRLYKVQLEKAQTEILRAQNTLEIIDTQRYEAEKEAAQFRSQVRQLRQEQAVREAMEEGRRAGLREGLEHGRHMGIQEAQIAFEEMELEESVNEGYYHHDDYPDDIDDEYRPRSRYIESSDASHRTMTPPPQRQEPPLPVPPPPLAQPVPVAHGAPPPRSYPSVRHSPVSIPPDGYIPALDADHIIRIPPPHEFSRPPPTPEPVASPQLPRDEQLPSQPPPAAQRSNRGGGHRVRHTNSSPGSTSTGLSQFDMVSDPPYAAAGLRTPLSVIHEGNSTHTTSPNPQSANDLRHQSSWGGSSYRSNSGPPPALPDLGAYVSSRTHYHRPTLSDTSSDSLLTAEGNDNGRRRSFASVSTLPDINIQPPSRPTSYGTPGQQHPNGDGNSVNDYFHADTAAELAPTMPNPVVLPDNQLPQGFVPTGGFTPTPSSTSMMPSGFNSNSNERPVIPDPALFRHSNSPDSPDDDDDAVSSAMSADTLTTPPPNGNRTRRRTRVSGMGTARAGDDTPMIHPPTHPSSTSGLGLWTSSSPSPAPIPIPAVPIGGGSVSGRSVRSRPGSTVPDAIPIPMNMNMGLDTPVSTGKSRHIRVGSTDTLMTPPPGEGRGRLMDMVGGAEVTGMGSGSKAGNVVGSKAGSRAGSIAGGSVNGSAVGGGTARSLKSRPGSRNANRT